MESANGRSSYVESKPTSIPCSPRLVQRRDNQSSVVTKMLRSYPQPDGSFVCPIRQPTERTGPHQHQYMPPPLPAKTRNKSYPKVTVQIPYRIANQSPVLAGHRVRSVTHQPQGASSTNQHTNRPLYTRTQSYPNNINAALRKPTTSPMIACHFNTVDTLHATSSEASPRNSPTQGLSRSNSNIIYSSRSRGNSTTKGTPLVQAKATYLKNGPYTRTAVIRSNSHLSSSSGSTYTGSMEHQEPQEHEECGRVRNGSHPPKLPQCDSMTSSVEEGHEDENGAQELYPEQR